MGAKGEKLIKNSYPLIDVTTDMMEAAKIREAQIPSTIRNSILKGDGRYTGCLGEIAFEIYTGGIKNPSSSPWHYDVILNGKNCEIKSKKRTVEPKNYYECSVSNANDKQLCDYYVFTSILSDYSKVWIVGYLSREEFMEKRKFFKKGDLDVRNNYICRADCWNVYIDELHPIKTLL